MSKSSPPGPTGLPFVGSAVRFYRNQLDFLTDCHQIYGDITSISLGPNDAYIITHPTDIEQVLVRDADSYRKPDFGGAMHEVIGNGLLLDEGGDSWWTKRRRHQPAYRLKKFMEQQVGMARRYTAHRMTGWHDGDTIAIREEMIRLATQITGDAMFDVSFDDETVESFVQPLGPLGEAFEPNIVKTTAPDWIPWPSDRRFEAAKTSLHEFIADLVRQRRREFAAPDRAATETSPSDERTDVLSLMVQAAERDEISEELLIEEILTVVLAGSDSTRLVLSYTWYLLSQNPEVERQLHDELESVLGGDPPTAEDLENLEYTERVLTEAMRVYPPVHQLVRESRESVELAGYRIPANSLVLLPQWIVHRDSRWYDDPETFDPDRWQQDRRSDRPQYAYFPFGWGPRQCIAKPIAITEMKLILSMIAQQYRLEPTSNSSLDLTPTITLHPSEPIEMTVHER